MIDTELLKSIGFLKGLPDNMLASIATIAEIREFGEEAVLFEQGQPVEAVYMLLEGIVFLNCKSPAGRVLTLDQVTPGRCFGISAVMDEVSSSFTAICGLKSRFVILDHDRLKALFEEDRELGYTLMVRVVELFKSRMDIHTSQFLHSLATHPDVRRLNPAA